MLLRACSCSWGQPGGTRGQPGGTRGRPRAGATSSLRGAVPLLSPPRCPLPGCWRCWGPGHVPTSPRPGPHVPMSCPHPRVLSLSPSLCPVPVPIPVSCPCPHVPSLSPAPCPPVPMSPSPRPCPLPDVPTSPSPCPHGVPVSPYPHIPTSLSPAPVSPCPRPLLQCPQCPRVPFPSVPTSPRSPGGRRWWAAGTAPRGCGSGRR